MSQSSFHKSLAISVLAISLTACADANEGLEVTFIGKLAVAPPTEDAMMARIEGTLRETDDCIVLSLTGGGEVLPVFPSDAVQRDEAGGGYLLNDAPLDISSTQTFGGGEVKPVEGSSLAAAERCNVETLWLIG